MPQNNRKSQVRIPSKLNTLVQAISCIALATAAAVTQAQSNRGELEEVIVTAQKRVENLQDVPVSVSAMSGEQLEIWGINDLDDAFQHTPGVTFTKSPQGNIIAIRGVSSGLNDGFEQSVGTYIDGIYMGRSNQSRAPFFDLERMELLRGPQGTLFGKNTIAGAINITSRSPEPGEEMSARVIANYEPGNDNYSGHNETVALSAPLGEKAATRIALYNQQSDGYVNNNYLSGRDEGENRNKAGRVTFVYDPIEALRFNLKWTVIDHKAKGNTASPLRLTLIDPDAALGVATLAFTKFLDPTIPVDKFHRNSLNHNPGMSEFGYDEGLENEANYGVLNTEYEFNSGHLVTLVTSYSKYDNKQSRDTDFLPVSFATSDRHEEFDQYAAEIRLTSPQDERFRYIAGAYYDNQNLDVDLFQTFDTSFDGLSNLLGYSSVFEPLVDGALFPGAYENFAPFVGLFSDSKFNQDSDSYSLFAEFNYDVTDTVTISLAGRYTKEKKKAKQIVVLTSDADDASPLAPLIVKEVFAAFGQAAWTSDTLTDPTTGAPLNFNEVKDSQFDPSVKLMWNFSDDAMAYVTYAEGFKSGGYNAHPSAVGPTDPATGNPSWVDYTFEPEKAKTYEVGVKSTWLDNSLRVNAAVYHTEYDDLQVSTFNGVVFVVDNAARSTVKGFELDTQWAATANWELGASAAYVDYEFDSYKDGPCTIDQQVAQGQGCTQDLGGKGAAFAPKWSGSVYTNYIYDISANYALAFDADANMRSSSYSDFDLDKATKESGYTKVNMRLAFGPSDNDWSIYAYGKNIGNVQRNSFIFDTPNIPGSYTGTPGLGRILGMGFNKNF